jgi:branched-chain amino acid transport system permease protein
MAPDQFTVAPDAAAAAADTPSARLMQYLAPGLHRRGRRRPFVEGAALAVTAAAVLLIGKNDAYWTSLLLQGLLFALLAQALNLIAGYGGRLAFGNALFFGFGAYAVALGASHGWYAPIVGLSIGIAASAVVAYAMGCGLWRVGGLMFALVTFAIASMVSELAALPAWTGAATGLAILVPHNVSIVHLSAGDQYRYLIVGVVLVIAVGIGTRLFVRSRWGILVMAIRDDRTAASTCGVNARHYLAVVWAVSAAVSAVAGAYYVQSSSFIDPPTAFGFSTGTQILLVLIVGGIGSVWGPVVGAAAVPLSVWLNRYSSPTGFQGVSDVVYGAILVIVVRLLPTGLVPSWHSLWTWVAGRFAATPAESDYEADVAVEAAGVEEGAGGDIDAEVLLSLASVLERQRPAAEVDAAGRAAGTAPVLELRDVAKSFGGLRAVRGVSFRVDRGEIVGLVGPNGAGKTTLFHCITGVVRPDSGSVILSGRELAGRQPYEIARAGISRTFQTVRLFPSLTARENVSVPVYGRRSGDRSGSGVDELLQAVGLSQRGDDTVASLPLIDQRRVELARAIAGGGEVVLLDEVLTGLEESEAREIGEVIRGLARSLGTSFIVVEHVMGTLLPMIDRVVVMDAGAVIADGLPRDVMSRQEVVEAYFGRRATVA